MSALPCFLLLISTTAAAEEVRVAVAANFAAPARALAGAFERSSGHRIVATAGSTGKFYAQIHNGAPFDVLLAADSETPRRLARESKASLTFTYAVGKLVLWSPRPGFVDAQGAVLRSPVFKRLAIANPKLAPYGAAAREALQKLGVWPQIEPRLVMGENIAQTFQFVQTGNAELGFIALSQLGDGGNAAVGSAWIVPPGLYSPIRQDAALLERGARNTAARAYLDYLRSPGARKVIESFGYELP